MSVIEIIIRRGRYSQVFLGVLFILSTMDHTKLQPVRGILFILSSHITTFIKKIKLNTSIKCAGDDPFEILQHILSLFYSLYTTYMIIELLQLLRCVPKYVKNWSCTEIE